MRDLWTTMETNRHRPPRWGSATLGLAKLVVVRRQNSLFSGCIVQDRIEMTRMSWISTSLHTHPLSPLIRAGALGIANVIRLQAVGQARPSARGRAEVHRIQNRDECAPPTCYSRIVTNDMATIDGSRFAFRVPSLGPARLPRVHKTPHVAVRVVIRDKKRVLMHIIQERYTHSKFAFLSAHHTAAHSR